MAVVSAKSPLEHGVQSIVNLQFRKEHRALLTILEDLRTKVEKSSADAERQFEESQKQSKNIENRLDKLENAWRERIQESKEWKDEVKSLKEKMERFSGLMGEFVLVMWLPL